jgi:hypothetical protein
VNTFLGASAEAHHWSWASHNQSYLIPLTISNRIYIYFIFCYLSFYHFAFIFIRIYRVFYHLVFTLIMIILSFYYLRIIYVFWSYYRYFIYAYPFFRHLYTPFFSRLFGPLLSRPPQQQISRPNFRHVTRTYLLQPSPLPPTILSRHVPVTILCT